MKRILSLFISGFCLFISLFAQNSESNLIYACAVEKYIKNDFYGAIRLFEKCDSIDAITLDSASNRRDYSHMWIASCYYKLNLEEKAKSISPEYYRLPPIDRRKTIASDSLATIALHFYETHQFEDALNFFLEAAKIEKDSLGNSHYLANSLQYCMMCCVNLDDLENALYFARKSSEITKDVYGNESLEYLNSLLYISKVHELSYQYEEAINCEIEYLSLATKVGSDITLLVSSRRRLSRYYSELGDYPHAIDEELEIIEICKQINNSEESNEFHSVSLSNLALYNALLGNHDIAIRLIEEAGNFIKDYNGDSSLQYAKYLDLKATVYNKSGLNDDAIILSNKALKIKECIEDCEYKDIYSTKQNLATYLAEAGHYTQSVSILSDIIGTIDDDSPLYGITLLNLGAVESERGNKDHAKTLYKQALSIFETTIGKDSPQYVESLFKLSELYHEVDSVEYALSNINECLKLSAEVFDTLSVEYAKALRLYALILSDNNIDGGLAISYAQKSSDIYESILGKQCDEYLGAEEVLAQCLFENGKVEESLRLSKSIIDESYNLGQTDSDIYWNLFNYAYDLSRTGKHEEALKYWQKTLDGAKNMALSKKEIVSEMEYEKINAELQAYYLYMLPAISVQNSNKNNWNTLNYNSILCAKNFLLECDRDSLRKTKNVNYEDISERLKSTDVAIEFETVIAEESIDIYALIAKNSYLSPKLYRICSLDSLLSISRNSKTDNRIYDLIWRPLETELIGVERIIFSPTSILHGLPIESIKGSDGLSIYDSYNVYRVSSTKEILRQEVSFDNNLYLYGGIDYDALPLEIKGNNEINRFESVNPLLAYRGQTKGSKTLSYLQGSLDEVTNIERIVKEQKECSVFTGASATEESFKHLSDLSSGVVHVATHGFYYEEEAFINKKITNIDMLKKDIKTYEDKTLIRSGLYFAGSNNTIKSDVVKNDIEDGILYSLEISKLNLTGTNLIVLSTCQSGLGELNGDGVLGLQRGFKKAGVNSILMTLWNVNDTATQLFMESFYQSLILGNSKSVSLHNAQIYLREYEDENGVKIFDEPEYWAAYILLDAIN